MVLQVNTTHKIPGGVHTDADLSKTFRAVADDARKAAADARKAAVDARKAADRVMRTFNRRRTGRRTMRADRRAPRSTPYVDPEWVGKSIMNLEADLQDMSALVDAFYHNESMSKNAHGGRGGRGAPVASDRAARAAASSIDAAATDVARKSLKTAKKANPQAAPEAAPEKKGPGFLSKLLNGLHIAPPKEELAIGAPTNVEMKTPNEYKVVSKELPTGSLAGQYGNPEYPKLETPSIAPEKTAAALPAAAPGILPAYEDTRWAPLRQALLTGALKHMCAFSMETYRAQLAAGASAEDFDLAALSPEFAALVDGLKPPSGVSDRTMVRRYAKRFVVDELMLGSDMAVLGDGPDLKKCAPDAPPAAAELVRVKAVREMLATALPAACNFVRFRALCLMCVAIHDMFLTSPMFPGPAHNLGGGLLARRTYNSGNLAANVSAGRSAFEAAHDVAGLCDTGVFFATLIKLTDMITEKNAGARFALPSMPAAAPADAAAFGAAWYEKYRWMYPNAAAFETAIGIADKHVAARLADASKPRPAAFSPELHAALLSPSSRLFKEYVGAEVLAAIASDLNSEFNHDLHKANLAALVAERVRVLY